MGDLKIADAALGEMTEAFRVFRPYRAVRKLTMFGSARTQPDDPVYVLARDLAAQHGRGRLDGGHRRRSGDHGRRHRGGGPRPRLRRQHPAPPRGGGQPLHRPGPQAGGDAVLLHPQADADQGVRRLRRPARGLRDPGRVLRAADPAADRQGRAGPGGPGRDARGHLLARAGSASWTRRPSGPAGSPPRTCPSTGWPTRWRRRPARSSASTATTTPAAGWATCWSSASRWPPAGPSWPTSTGASPTSWCRAPSGQPRRSRPSGPGSDHLELPRVAFRFDRFHYARLRLLIDALNECTGEGSG